MSNENATTNKPVAKIHQAIIAIMRAVGPIAKDSQNTQQNYRFRGIDAVYNACHPHFAEHGVFSTSEIVENVHTTEPDKNGKPVNRAILKIRFTYFAEDGSHVSTEVVGEGMDYGGDKASNKAMSVADKYALLQLLKIPVAMVDPDRSDPPVRNPGRRSEPKVAPRDSREKQQPILDRFVAVKDRWKIAQIQDGGFAEPQDWQQFVCASCEGIDPKNCLIPAAWKESELDAVDAQVVAIERRVMKKRIS